VDFGRGQLREVECVKGLRVLEQHIVGDVDDVVDGPHAAGAQASLEPIGTRADFHALDDSADVAGA